MPNIRKSAVAKFRRTESFNPRNKKEELLINAVKKLKTEQEVANFLRDIMTLAEIEELSNRISIAKKLLEGESYQEIAKEINTSTTTVTRVSHWLFSGCGGYYKALTKK